MKSFFIDIDNTITLTTDKDYQNAVPLFDRIAIVNSLFEAGHHITMWTARGAKAQLEHDLDQCNRLHLLTLKQLKSWGVKYHVLRMDKPMFDVLVDDKAFSSLSEVV